MNKFTLSATERLCYSWWASLHFLHLSLSSEFQPYLNTLKDQTHTYSPTSAFYTTICRKDTEIFSIRHRQKKRCIPLWCCFYLNILMNVLSQNSHCWSYLICNKKGQTYLISQEHFLSTVLKTSTERDREKREKERYQEIEGSNCKEKERAWWVCQKLHDPQVWTWPTQRALQLQTSFLIPFPLLSSSS